MAAKLAVLHDIHDDILLVHIISSSLNYLHDMWPNQREGFVTQSERGICDILVWYIQWTWVKSEHKFIFFVRDNEAFNFLKATVMTIKKISGDLSSSTLVSNLILTAMSICCVLSFKIIQCLTNWSQSWRILNIPPFLICSLLCSHLSPFGNKSVNVPYQYQIKMDKKKFKN